MRLQKLPTGQYAVVCAPRGNNLYILVFVSLYQIILPYIFTAVPPAQRRHSLDLGDLQSSKTLARSGSAQLNRQLNLFLPPVQLKRTLSTPSCGIRQERISSASNDRARRGFKFWPQDKANSASRGTKVNMGSKGTFLGLGVPRL